MYHVYLNEKPLLKGLDDYTNCETGEVYTKAEVEGMTDVTIHDSFEAYYDTLPSVHRSTDNNRPFHWG